jgi:cation transport ATPase
MGSMGGQVPPTVKPRCTSAPALLTELLRRVSSRPLLSTALTGALWLLYEAADDVAIYVLGHMSLSARPRGQQQLMAFWASLLLVHLGGQDNVTAYAMEDNELWLRHLFTLMVQAAGAAYVLYKYASSGSRALFAAAVLMFLVGVGKYLQVLQAGEH